MVAAAQAQVEALTCELRATKRKLKDLRAEQNNKDSAMAATSASSQGLAGCTASRTSGHGSDTASAPAPTDNVSVRPGRGPESGLADASELRDARARVSSLEQELHVVQGKLSAILSAAQASCKEHIAVGGGGGFNPGTPEGAGLWGLLGALRCTELLYTKEERDTSLANIRMLQVGRSTSWLNAHHFHNGE